MTYEILYYDEDLQQQILELPAPLVARYVVLTERMQEYGANLGMPHTKAMSDGLFELRLKANKNIARVFYCTLINQRIVMLYSFVKKTQKTPKKELNIAKKRLQEIKNANSQSTSQQN